MGIYTHPPHWQERPPHTSSVLNWIAIGLAVASLVIFGLVGGAGLDGIWLVLALGAALLALALLLWRV